MFRVPEKRQPTLESDFGKLFQNHRLTSPSSAKVLSDVKFSCFFDEKQIFENLKKVGPILAMGKHYFNQNLVRQFVYFFVFVLLNMFAVTIAMSKDISPVFKASAFDGLPSVKDNLVTLDNYEHFDDLEQIKQNLLKELGLNQIPDVTKMNISQEDYTRTYQKYAEEQAEEAIQTAKENSINNPFLPTEVITQRFFSFETYDMPRPDSLQFKPYLPREKINKINSATLRLLIEGSTQSLHGTEQTANVTVYQEIPNEPKKFVTTKTVYLPHGSPRWNHFDVDFAMEHNLNHNLDFLNLQIVCDQCKIVNPKNSTLNVLISLNELISTSRVKRAAGRRLIYRGSGKASKESELHSGKYKLTDSKHRKVNCTKEENYTRCCRYPLEVVFKELQTFDYILEPKSYDAGYCKGHCPIRYNPANMHSLMQGFMRKRDAKIPKLCCTPSHYEPLKIIFLDHQQRMQVKTWEKMRVSACSCH